MGFQTEAVRFIVRLDLLIFALIFWVEFIASSERQRLFDPWLEEMGLGRISRRRACSFYKLLPLIYTPAKRPIVGLAYMRVVEGIGAAGEQV